MAMYSGKRGKKSRRGRNFQPGTGPAPVAKGAFRVPKEWSFKNPDIAAHFDTHVREQLPWFDLATGIVAHLGRSYIPEGGMVIDVGCSTGNIGRSLAGTLEARKAVILPFDPSPDMKARYDGPGGFIIDSAESFPWQKFAPDLIVCFLALMFVPVRKRAQVIAAMKASIAPGGALIVFDKMVPRPGYVGTAAYRLTLAAKYEAGAAPDEIIAKELSIAGLQRPMSESELAGFVEIFRFGDFAGFVWESPA